MKKYNTSYVIS